MNKTGIMSTAYFDLNNFENGIAKMKAHGYDCMDYQNIVSPFCNIFNYKEDEFERYFYEFGECAKTTGIEIFQMHGLWPRFADGDLTNINKDLDLYFKQMQAAK